MYKTCTVSVDQLKLADLDKGEFAGALAPIGDCHLAILVHPALAAQHVVDARCHLLPLVVVIMSVHTNTYTHTQRGMEREGGGGAGGGREKCVLCTDESQQAKTILYAVVCSSINKSTIPHLYTCVYSCINQTTQKYMYTCVYKTTQKEPYFGMVTLTVPTGNTSILLPQNLLLILASEEKRMQTQLWYKLLPKCWRIRLLMLAPDTWCMHRLLLPYLARRWSWETHSDRQPLGDDDSPAHTETHTQLQA